MFGFGRKHREEKAEAVSSVGAPEQWLADLLGGGTATEAGETVGAESAVRVPAVLAATRTIAETVGSLPIHLYRRGPDGARQRDRDHPAARALAQPSPWLSAYELKVRLITDAIRHGRGLAVAARGGDRIELHPVQHGSLEVRTDAYGEPSYVLTVGTIRRPYAWPDVVHIEPLPSDNGQPLSIIAAAREAIGFAVILQKHGSRLFRNGARPSGVLSFAEKLNDVETSNIRKLWNLAHGGRRSGGTAILDRSGTYQPLGFNSVDAQFLELWRFSVLEIARAFRIPPHMLAELERATHSNAEEQGLQFVSYCLRPWADLLEGALTRVLLTPEERETFFLEVNFDDLTRGNIAQRFDALQKSVGGPWLTPDEARAIENRAPIDGGHKLNQPQGVAPAAEPTPAPAPGEPRLRAVA